MHPSIYRNDTDSVRQDNLVAISPRNWTTQNIVYSVLHRTCIIQGATHSSTLTDLETDIGGDKNVKLSSKKHEINWTITAKVLVQASSDKAGAMNVVSISIWSHPVVP